MLLTGASLTLSALDERMRLLLVGREPPVASPLQGRIRSSDPDKAADVIAVAAT
jgi:hypothetical protein